MKTSKLAAEERVEHTPTPWQLDDMTVQSFQNPENYGYTVAECGERNSLPAAEKIANAELICRAVNSHEALVSALRGLVYESQAILGYVQGHGGCESAIKALEVARAALQAAGPDANVTLKAIK